MPKGTPLINNFNAGELSPKVDVRADLQKYYYGCHKMENFYPLLAGAAKRVPGTKYIGEIKVPVPSSSPSVSAPPWPNLYFIEMGPAPLHNHVGIVYTEDFTFEQGPEIVAFTVHNGGVISPDNAYYFQGTVGGLYRINLPEGTVESFMAFDVAEHCDGICLDPTGTILYAWTYPGNLMRKIDLATFTVTDTSADLTASVTAAAFIVADDDYIYLGDAMTLHRINASTLAYVDHVHSGGGSVVTVLCQDSNNVYFGVVSPFYTLVAKVAKSTFAIDATSFTLSGGGVGGSGYCALAIDTVNDRLYVASSAANPAQIYLYKINTDTWSVVGDPITVTLSGSDWAQCLVLDQTNQKLYMGLLAGSTGTSVIKFDLATFTQEDTLAGWDDEALNGVIENV